MRLPWRKPTPPPAPRASALTIAVLEAEELGIQPEPGTAAAVVVALRSAFGPRREQPPAED